jgi:hypothetical protein
VWLTHARHRSLSHYPERRPDQTIPGLTLSCSFESDSSRRKSLQYSLISRSHHIHGAVDLWLNAKKWLVQQYIVPEMVPSEYLPPISGTWWVP